MQASLLRARPPNSSAGARPARHRVAQCGVRASMPAAAPAQLAAELEQRAAAAHLEAQALNKEGRYEDARAKYAEMRALDAEALRLSVEAGCVGCTLADDGGPSSSGSLPQASPAVYRTLHSPRPWPGPDAARRATSAVLASAVADAAATGVQWIYDTSVLQQLLEEPGRQGLEFMDPPRSPFLPQYAVGRPSPYGEETWVLLRSLAQQGGLQCERYAALYFDQLGEGFDGYRNASTTAFLRNHARGLAPPETGAADQQADCVARLAPLVAMFAGDVRLMQLVEAATRTTQNTDEAVAWAAVGSAVLERVVLGSSAAAAVEDTIGELTGAGIVAGRMPVGGLAPQLAQHLQQVLDLRATPVEDVISRLGRNCHMPNACQTPLHVVLHHEWRMQQEQQQQQQPWAGDSAQAQAVFAAGIRDALAGGGCCASRAGFAGALLGALLGSCQCCIPDSWSRRCLCWDDVSQAAQRLSAARSGQ